jgi:hypothetical protein
VAETQLGQLRKEYDAIAKEVQALKGAAAQAAKAAAKASKEVAASKSGADKAADKAGTADKAAKKGAKEGVPEPASAAAAAADVLADMVKALEDKASALEAKEKEAVAAGKKLEEKEKQLDAMSAKVGARVWGLGLLPFSVKVGSGVWGFGVVVFSIVFLKLLLLGRIMCLSFVHATACNASGSWCWVMSAGCSLLVGLRPCTVIAVLYRYLAMLADFGYHGLLLLLLRLLLQQSVARW